MKPARVATFALISSWIVACATAQDNTVPGDGTGATGTGASSGSTGASGSLGRGGTSSSSAGTNGAFGGSGALPGSSGSSGVAGHGGATSSAGAGGLGASGGVGGASGGSASAGSGGTAGGAGGSGGSAPVFEAGQCAASPTMTLSYEQSNTGQQITGQYQFANVSDAPIPVASLKIRYFFTNEHTLGWNNAVYDAKVDGGTLGYRPLSGTTLAEGVISPALDGADAYAEVSFAATTVTIEKGATGTVSWDMQPIGYNAPFQIQTNDYSFNAADTVFTPWDHIAIYQGDTLVFGCLPQALGGSGGAGGQGGGAGAAGSAGAGGATSSAGAGGATSSGGAGGDSGASGSAGSGDVAGSGGTATAGGTAGTGGTAGSP